MIKKLKYYLSFLIDLPVEKIPSEHSRNLEVDYYKGEYVLSTALAIYSHGKQYEPFSVSFENIEIEKRKINSVLLLGLGLGSIPVLLNERGVNCQITCVELDESIIAVCEKYLDAAILSRLNIVCSDAECYVATCKEKFDLIINDTFIDNQIPKKFQTEKYSEQLNKLLSPGGMLLFNRLMTTAALKEESINYLETIFEKKFPTSRYIRTKSNLVLVYEN